MIDLSTIPPRAELLAAIVETLSGAGIQLRRCEFVSVGVPGSGPVSVSPLRISSSISILTK